MRRLTGANEDFVARESAARRRVNALVRAGADSATIMLAARELVTQQTAGLTDDERRAVGDIDSLTMVRIDILIQSNIGLALSADDLEGITTVEDLVTKLLTRGQPVEAID